MKNTVKRFTLDVNQAELKMLDELCKMHHRKYREELTIMIRFYYKNHLRTEEYFE